MDDGSSIPDNETVAAHARRLDRELNELLQELRVVQGGILLVIGFLLVVAFSAGFQRITDFQKLTYFVTLVVTGSSAIVVVAPVVHHRLAFRRRDKERVVVRGNLMVLVSIGLVALSILGILVLVTDLLWPGWVVITFALLYALLVAALWVVLPLHSIAAAARGE